MYFIDWVSCVVSIPHHNNSGVGFGSDGWINFDRLTGDVKKQGFNPAPIKGSFDSSVIIKSQNEDDEGLYQELYISGNLNKFLNGHNLWGCADLKKLLLAFLVDLQINFDVEFKVHPSFVINKGFVNLTRLDLTTHFTVGDDDLSVKKWLTSAAVNADMKYRGRGVFKNQTLRFGSGRRSSIKFYGKYKEFFDNIEHQRIDNIDLLETIKNHMRCEMTIRSLQLKDLEINTLQNFKIDKLIEYMNMLIENIKLPQQVNLNTEQLDGLTPSAQLAYRSFLDGHPLSSLGLPKSTYYNLKKQLMKAGINPDIPPTARKKESVVVLADILTASPVTPCDEIIKTLRVA